MSRVFLAEEVDLGRRVVIKVLPPEMAASVNVERFRREIQLAAKLQHPHIVPLLTAGATEDLLYYVMPFIEGESLRTRLGREGELPVAEAVRILKDVLDALAYAHAQGVVHRDIKPDNVMLAGKHALVTDFGVAKAVSASAGSSSLTSLGMALGTPAYMAPEQAAGDPNVDYRADLYAVGAMAYEMLAGRAPFDGLAPQAVLAAHVTQAPDALVSYRATVPPVLNELVMRSLEKRPADRWQRAEEMVAALDAVLTPTGGVTPMGLTPMTPLPLGPVAQAVTPGRLAVLLGVGGAVALGLVYLAVLQLGLPDWVLSAAIGLLIVGLPYVAATGYVEGQRARARAKLTAAQRSGGIRAWLTWRRALMGGATAFGVLGAATAGYMLMRAMGIGPVGTLVASGVLAERDRLILSAFDNRTADSTLGQTVGELFRVDLAQSRTVTVLEPVQVSAVLQRMQRDPAAPVTLDLAREIAQREGLKAIVAGEVFGVGSGFVVSIRLVAAGTGDVLLADRETAAGPDHLVTAVDRLSARLRERIGESLKTIRAEPGLEQVTTFSTDALRKYAEADRANNMGDYSRAMALLQEAVTQDSGFAMAWRKLGVIRSNTAAPRESVLAALTKAYQHRDRLTERERYQTLGSYHMTVTRDRDASIAAYRSALERYPDDRVSLNNLALQYFELGRWAEAEDLIDRSLTLGGAPAATFVNAVVAKAAQGKFEAAEEALARFEQAYPGNPSILDQRASLAAARGQFAESGRYIQQLAEATPGLGFWQASVAGHRGALALVQGQLGAFARYGTEELDLAYELGALSIPRDLVEAASAAQVDLWVRGDAARALRRLDAALARNPRSFASARADGGALLDLAQICALGGRPERARQLLADFEASVPEEARSAYQGEWTDTRGAIAAAEGRYLDAVAEYRRSTESMACPICSLFEVGQAFERAGMSDSAVTAYQKYLTTPWLNRLDQDRWYLARVLRRLGELREAQGDRPAALEYYGRFVDLWKEADPDLQTAVREVKARMAKLTSS
jgi:tetratricopeptide (TPR) repeat protein